MLLTFYNNKAKQDYFKMHDRIAGNEPEGML